MRYLQWPYSLMHIERESRAVEVSEDLVGRVSIQGNKNLQ